MNIIEAITKRVSVRKYSDTPLTTDQINKLHEAIRNSKSPFGGNVEIEFVSLDSKIDVTPSTYGFISGASAYLLMTYSDDFDSCLSAGFRMEQVVLKATEMGLGTCWIGGTLKKDDFQRLLKSESADNVKIISPVGYAANRKSLLERIARATMGSNHRIAIDELYFENGFVNGIEKDNTFYESFEMMRLAPSARNSQPCRASVCDDTVDFYYIPKGDFSIVDCGIALCHFFETEKYNGFTGDFFKKDNNLSVALPHKWQYLVSYRRK